MKESTGELNVTVFVVVAVGVLMAIFYFTIWPVVKVNFNQNSQCSKAVCDNKSEKDGYVTCYPKGKYGDESESFQCVFKG